MPKNKGRGSGESRTSPRRLAIAEKARKALALKAAGLSLTAIADELGYNSKQAARAAIYGILDRTEHESAEDFRGIMMERLNRLLRSVWTRALQGDLPCVAAALRISEQMCKIGGIDKTPRYSIENGDLNIQQNIGIAAGPAERPASIVDDRMLTPERIGQMLEVARKHGLLPLLQPRILQASSEIQLTQAKVIPPPENGTNGNGSAVH